LKEITISSNEKSVNNLKELTTRLEKEKDEQAMKYELKIKNKKDKIRGLQTEYSEKNRNCEHFKIKIEGLENKLKEAMEQAQSLEDELKECKLKLLQSQEIEKSHVFTNPFVSFYKHPLQEEPSVINLSIQSKKRQRLTKDQSIQIEEALKSPQILLTSNSVNPSNTYLVAEAQDDVNFKDTAENLFPCP